MHEAVLSCDFLLAPAHCGPDAMLSRVADLAEYARSVQAQEGSPLLEYDALQKLIDSKQYPCEGLFKNNLKKIEEQIYTAKDIARIISNILEVGDEFTYAEDRLWECTDISSEPAYKGTNQLRTEELNNLIECVAVCNKLEAKSHSILHFCPQHTNMEVEFSGTLTEVIPPPEHPLPIELKQSVKLFDDYRHYLTSMCYQTALNADPENDELVKEALFWGALCSLKQRNMPLDMIDLSRFSLGAKFIESLKNNQCLPGQNFWNVCFSSIVAILTNDPTYEVNIFKKGEKSEEQKTAGNFKAFRSHITKGGVGLRLMFWRTDDGYVQLANVGPKQELVFAAPT